ncbi:hypothetical protein FALCPG4_003092 [Fusarium falciforme]
MMRSLDVWEEVPAWDEVWRLKLAFDRDRKADWHHNVKLYTIIVCKILPEMIMEALTRGAFDPKASDFAQQLQLPLTEDDLKRLLDDPFDCPTKWWLDLKEGGFTSLSHKHADSSPYQPPDFSSRQQKELANPLTLSWMPPDLTSLASKASSSTKGRLFGSTSNTLFGASPLPPNSTSSASKASSYTTVFGGTSNKLFGASPLPPDSTSSASKAPSYTTVFGTRGHGSPVSVSQGPKQVKSGGNLGATVSDPVESEGS